MTRIISLVLLAIFSMSANADDTDDVIGLIEKLWEARNANDYATQHDLISEHGTLSANSNGTFFNTAEKGTVDDLKEALSNFTSSNVSVRYPDAIALADTVILAYYYLEGQMEFADGTRVGNYRTRATHIWVKEGNEWKHRSWHFSPLHQGGTVRD